MKKKAVPPSIVKKLSVDVRLIFEKFAKADYQVYLVGGAVRDLYLGKIPQDVDFTTNAQPEQIQALFAKSFYDNAFGTVGVILPESREKKRVYEITTFRSESTYSDKRRPDKVKWGKTLAADVKRRDFTINAMAIGRENNKYYLYDNYTGAADMKKRLIRAVGVAEERFAEDALRMIRAVRLATQLGFNIETRTMAAIQANAKDISRIANERVRDELFKILESERPAEGITLLKLTGLLEYILPELLKGDRMTQAKHHIYDVYTHSLLALKYSPSKDRITRLATLLHDVGKAYVRAFQCQACKQIFHQHQAPDLICPNCGYQNIATKASIFYNHEVKGARLCRVIADRLRLSKKDKHKLVNLVRWHQFTSDEFLSDKAIRRFVRRVTPEYIPDMFALRIGDRLGGGCTQATSWRLKLFMKRVEEVQKHTPSVKDLKINGDELMKRYGVKPGPILGLVLSQLFYEVVEEGLVNKPDVLKKRAQELLDSYKGVSRSDILKKKREVEAKLEAD